MNCPNCGLANEPQARFCANCGTPLTATGQLNPQPLPPVSATGNSSPIRKVALGCLIALAIFFFFGLSCTRACFRPRRYSRRHYVRVIATPVSFEGRGRILA